MSDQSRVSLLESLVEHSENPLVRLDRDFNFLYVNRAYADACRRAPEELIGHNHFELYPHAENRAIFERVRDTGEPAVWREKPFVFPDQPERGTTYWDWTLTPVKDEHGRVNGLVFSLRDVTDKVVALRGLKEREARLRDVLEHSPDALYRRDLLADRYEYLSPVLEQVTGYSVAEFTSLSLHDVLMLIHPDDRPAVDEAVRRAEPKLALEYRLRCKDGRYRWLADYATTTCDEEGRPRYVGGNVRDVTERKEAEEALNRYELLARHSRDIMLFIRRDDGRILDVNAAALAAYGYSRDELLTLTVFNLRADPGTGLTLAQLTEADTNGIRFEAVHRRKDGTTFPVEVSSQGATIGSARTLVSVVRDITDCVRAEAALRESEQRVRLKLESILSPEGEVGNLPLEDLIDVAAMQALMDHFAELVRVPMAIIDLKGKVLVGVGWQDICVQFHRTNPRTCEYCIESDTQLTAGIAPGEFRVYRCKNNMWDAATPLLVGGRHVGNIFIGQFFFEDEQPDYEQFRAQARKYGFAESEYLAALERVPRLSRESVKATREYLLRLAQMISKLSYANVKLARSLHEGEVLTGSLREADRRKDEFLAVLSHELRGPLAPIRNSIFVLQHAPPGGEQARRAQDIIDWQSAHLSRLVDDLLDLNRISRGKIQLERVRCDLSELVHRTAEDHRANFINKGVGLQVEIAHTPLWVEADATRIAQVVGNLLGNAGKFTPHGGSVQVTVTVEDSQAVVRVRDTGAGIAPELLGMIFDPFTQAEQTIARSLGGLGLGLALVKGFVEMHGGTVCALSEGPGRGAEFVVRLPLLQRVVVNESRRAAIEARHRLRVVVIEDNRDAAESLRDVLAFMGHEAQVAFSGASGLATVRAARPNMVLCDIGLPDMDGYAVARALRADPQLAACQLIALTGYAQREDLEKAKEAGFERHLAKPPSLEKLRELLASALGAGLTRPAALAAHAPRAERFHWATRAPGVRRERLALPPRGG